MSAALTAAFPVDQYDVSVFTCSASDADPPYQQIMLIQWRAQTFWRAGAKEGHFSGGFNSQEGTLLYFNKLRGQFSVFCKQRGHFGAGCGSQEGI